MVLLDITSYIPTTLFGLLALLFGYIYKVFRSRDQNKIETLNAIPSKDRLRVMEAMLNDLSIPMDTSDLTPKQKHNLIIEGLSARTHKYLIIAITCIILSGFATFLIWKDNKSSNLKVDSQTDKIEVDSQKNDTSVQSKVPATVPDSNQVVNSQEVSVTKIPKPIQEIERQKATVSETEVKLPDANASYDLNTILGKYGTFYSGDIKISYYQGNLTIEQYGENTFSIRGEYEISYPSGETAERDGQIYDIMSRSKAEFHSDRIIFNNKSLWMTVPIEGTYKESAFGNQTFYIDKVIIDVSNKKIKFASIVNDINKEVLHSLMAKDIYWRKLVND